MSGTPVFIGTRVPLKNLMDYVNAGDSVEEFLKEFSSVSWERVVMVLSDKELYTSA